jgi:hypothetical protein
MSNKSTKSGKSGKSNKSSKSGKSNKSSKSGKSIFSKDSDGNLLVSTIFNGRRKGIILNEDDMISNNRKEEVFFTSSEQSDKKTSYTSRTDRSNVFSDIMSDDSLIPVDEFFNSVKKKMIKDQNSSKKFKLEINHKI